MCESYLKGLLLANWAVQIAALVAIGIALYLLALQGLKALRAKPAGETPAPATDAESLTLEQLIELLKELRNLIPVLSAAPAPIVLIIFSLLLIWLPDFAIPQSCLDLLPKQQGSA